ncbi:hypothetical protein [Vibrio vulnificus]|uniref:hypothetical protein n=1 Tax=Vibrio vulnificus TaxID=672 RepID=UPI0005F14373|nr:hypothetical protein [Vibrio vulnificus]HDY7671209.1 hypothetical protein [Vibrio vulnificus]
MTIYSIASACHRNQKFEDERYINHLSRVSKKVAAVFRTDDKDANYLLHDIAWLKDVFVMTGCSIETIHSRLSRYHLYDRMMEALEAISQKQGEQDSDYFERCSRNPIALKVKIAETMVKVEERIKYQDIGMAKFYTVRLNLLLSIYEEKQF